ncbi:hypothetical protein PNK_2167 [Candidatus Protochlamydia naegleriophila]|uniref:Uncharacterized protein n=1 Tax=Candidatus Protochlamydia naegleriophila TaxID=389348 RepID=A0A0U5JD18_9BACT|nr:hypothetical protein [Candidatus Protochlamydia naegleriophila]CUI17768.1 hypothetical protein PNK_2167 [Candidatus Protochlamydia naegleriophila]
MIPSFQISSPQLGMTIIEQTAIAVQNPLEALKLLNGRQVNIINRTDQSIKTIALYLYQECQRSLVSRSLNYLSQMRFIGGVVETFAPASNVDSIYQEIVAREDKNERILDKTIYLGGNDGEYVEIGTVSPRYLYLPDWQASLLASTHCNDHSNNSEGSPPHSTPSQVGLNHIPLIDTETESIDVDSELEEMMRGCMHLDQQQADTDSCYSFESEDSLASLETLESDTDFD